MGRVWVGRVEIPPLVGSLNQEVDARGVGCFKRVRPRILQQVGRALDELSDLVEEFADAHPFGHGSYPLAIMWLPLVIVATPVASTAWCRQDATRNVKTQGMLGIGRSKVSEMIRRGSCRRFGSVDWRGCPAGHSKRGSPSARLALRRRRGSCSKRCAHVSDAAPGCGQGSQAHCRRLGHSNERMVLQRCQHLLPGADQEAARLPGELIRRPSRREQNG